MEETLRYEPPSPVQARYVAADVEHYGHTVTEGSYMLLLNGSANPTRFCRVCTESVTVLGAARLLV